MTEINEKIEEIDHAVHLIRNDLLKCGKLKREAARTEISFLTYDDTTTTLWIISGITGELMYDVNKGETAISIKPQASFKKGKQILIFDRENWKYDINEIQAVEGGKLILQEELQDSYPTKSSQIWVLRRVEHKYDSKRLAFKRKVNNGHFKTLLRGVTDIIVKYFPESNSVLYMIELHKKERIRAYIHLDKVDKRDGTDEE